MSRAAIVTGAGRGIGRAIADALGDVGFAVASLASGAIPYATGIHIDVGGGLQLHRI